VLRDPYARLISAYRSAALRGDVSAAGCSSLAEFVQQNRHGIAAGDLYTRMLSDPRPIGDSRDWTGDDQKLALAFQRITEELDGWFLLEQDSFDWALGQWLRLPGGSMARHDQSTFRRFTDVVTRGDRDPDQLKTLLQNIRVTESCLAMVREGNAYDLELFRRLTRHKR
jgi:hypothetical protein